MIDWKWIFTHFELFGELLGEHIYLSIIPVIIGLAVSLVLGVASRYWAWTYTPTLAVTSIFYAIPSIALFVFLLDYTGLTAATAIIPLTIYTVSVLYRNVVEGLRSVDDSVRQSASSMGFGPLRQLVQVELPIAAPVIIAGLRVATVANVSMVSIAALIGIGGLGSLFTEGIQRFFMTEILVGIVLTMALAFVLDYLLALAQRVITPWSTRKQGVPA